MAHPHHKRRLEDELRGIWDDWLNGNDYGITHDPQPTLVESIIGAPASDTGAEVELNIGAGGGHGGHCGSVRHHYVAHGSDDDEEDTDASGKSKVSRSKSVNRRAVSRLGLAGVIPRGSKREAALTAVGAIGKGVLKGAATAVSVAGSLTKAVRAAVSSRRQKSPERGAGAAAGTGLAAAIKEAPKEEPKAPEPQEEKLKDGYKKTKDKNGNVQYRFRGRIVSRIEALA